MAADYYSQDEADFDVPSPTGPPAGKIQFGTNPDGTPRYVDQMPAYDATHPESGGYWRFNQTQGDPNYLKWYYEQMQNAHTPQATQAPGWTAGKSDDTYKAPGGDWKSLSDSIFGPMPGIGDYPAFDFPSFNAPAPFAAPDSQTVLSQDPGYQFRVGEGSRALQQSAAARGSLNTGGTLKDLLNYGQGAASQEYGNAYNRALGTYQTNFMDALNAYQTNYGSALGKYNTNYGTQFQNPYALNWAQYQQGVGNQNQLFNQQFQTANG